jgi:outer membrane protein OmpA-like peptidoglycan-associated protein
LSLLMSAALVSGALAGCGDDPKPPAAAPTSESSAAASEEPQADETQSLPPGAQPGLDDHNGDGSPDPTCTTQDFGGGLVLRIPCEISNAHDPENGTRLVKDSLYRLPSFEADLTDISGSLVTARDPAGKKIVIVVFNSDNLFATGSDQVNDSNTLDATIRLINRQFANAAIQVRGHTDSTGSASANQSLSQRRAETVRAYLTGNGVNASGVTGVGFGSTRPLVEEDTAEGRAFNRRVELALRLP